ncbi:MAG: glycosyltransferase [Phycisphaera sp.]|nr:glycosyltransferase [Phycisphaera sp.]
MRIALDARTMYRPQRRGTGKNLIDLYRTVADMRPGWSVTGFHRTSHPNTTGLPESFLRGTRLESPGDRLDVWGRWMLPFAAWRGGADVMHCPSNGCPSWLPLPTVVTIHDLIPIDHPQDAGGVEQARRFERGIRQACRRASWVITPSAYTKNRLVEEYSADASRITVNPWAADSSVRRVPEDLWGPVLKKYGVNRSMVLHFGSGTGRKNTRRLIEAWATIEPALRRRWQLLVVGLNENGIMGLRGLCEKLCVQNSVVLHGFAEEGDIPTLLSAAGLLAYPSLSEGFGLPILDAWATLTPVLASANTSIPEVAGDAAVLVDPTDTCGIARGLSRLLSDSLLRNDLMVRGTRRLEKYSWQSTAERFIRVMERVAGLVEDSRVAA